MRFLSVISIVLLTAAAALTCWLFYRSVTGALKGLEIRRHWQPLRRVYTAHVIRFADRGGVKSRSTSLVIAIRFADGERRQFTSACSGTLHLLGIGDEVHVLTKTVSIAGTPIQEFEVDSAFELWIGDALWAVGILSVIVGVPLWIFRPVRFRR